MLATCPTGKVSTVPPPPAQPGSGSDSQGRKDGFDGHKLAKLNSSTLVGFFFHLFVCFGINGKEEKVGNRFFFFFGCFVRCCVRGQRPSQKDREWGFGHKRSPKVEGVVLHTLRLMAPLGGMRPELSGLCSSPSGRL